MINNTGFGLQATLVADKTFPAGISLTTFAKDTDPFKIDSTALKGTRFTLNGRLVSWDEVGGYPLSIALENGAEDDTKMQILAKANTAEFGKKVVTDAITITAIYPDGSKTIFSNGILLESVNGKSVASGGSIEVHIYKFLFQNKA